MSITEKALIVSLKISQWTGRKLDKDANHTVETEYKTNSRVGNYTKKLLPAAKELENVQRLASSIRQWFYEQTLPWCTDGSRILAAQNYMDFTAAYRRHRNEFDSAVAAFLQEYETLIGKARSELGNLFRESEYPTKLRLQTAFDCKISFMPVPDVNDFRVTILDSEKETFLREMKDVENAAMKECWQRLYDSVFKALTKLKDPNAIFRDSLIENVQEICTLLPKLNVSDDAGLEQMRTEVQALVSKVQPDTVRHNMHARNEVVESLHDITNKMGAYMGAFAGSKA